MKSCKRVLARLHRLEQSGERRRGAGDEGDTLIELLMALGVLGIVVSALLMGFWTSITSSVSYRTIATMDTVVRSATEQATSGFQQNASKAFSCPNGALTWNSQTAPYTPNFSLPSGYSAQITAVSYYTATGAASSTCVAGSPQLVSVQVIGAKSTESVNVVVDDPLAPTPAKFGAATQLVFRMPAGNPSGVAGSPLNPQPSVAVEDDQGNVVTTDLSTVRLTVSGASITNCSGVEFYGVVTFSNCEIDKAGSYTITATDGQLSTATIPVTVVAGPPAALVTSTPSIQGGTPFQTTVTVKDAFGNIEVADTSQVTLAMGTNPVGGTLTCAAGQNPVAAVAGVATFPSCQIDKAGSGYQLNAADGALTQMSPAFAVAVGPASQLTITKAPNAASNGVVFPSGSQPVVTIQDAGGNTVTTGSFASAKVTLALTPVSGRGTLSCTANPATAKSGIATFAGCKVTLGTAGTFTLTAGVTGLPPVTTPTFSVH